MNLPTLDNNDGSTPAARPKVCCLLRTKTAFGSYMMDSDDDAEGEGVPGWQTGNSTTAVFWCLKTMDNCGPDDDLAHAKTCRPGRACFRGDED
jgi:hypothetical protein